MVSNDHKAASRYSVGGSENEYMDAKQTVLKNKKGIIALSTLQIEEEKALVKAYELLLSEVRSDTPITAELIRHVHQRIFGDLYEWAGRWRTVTISKPGVTWPPPDFLEEAMQQFEQDVLMKYPSNALTSDDTFCSGIGHIQGEFLAIHPFREGNARTIKLVTDLLAVQTARLPFRYDSTDVGQDQYIDAAKAAILKDFDPMVEIIRNALIASREHPAP